MMNRSQQCTAPEGGPSQGRGSSAEPGAGDKIGGFKDQNEGLIYIIFHMYIRKQKYKTIL